LWRQFLAIIYRFNEFFRGDNIVVFSDAFDLCLKIIYRKPLNVWVSGMLQGVDSGLVENRSRKGFLPACSPSRTRLAKRNPYERIPTYEQGRTFVTAVVAR
jgi:hypothetical protein